MSLFALVLSVLLLHVGQATEVGLHVSQLSSYSTSSNLELHHVSSDVSKSSDVTSGATPATSPLASTLAVQRIVPTGHTYYGDSASTDGSGSLLVEVDLKVKPGEELEARSMLTFTVPAVTINGGNYAYTPASPALACYYRAAYIDPAASPSFDMLDRVYAGNFTGDGELYSDISSELSSSAKYNSGTEMVNFMSTWACLDYS
jgi:hypothetical protein